MVADKLIDCPKCHFSKSEEFFRKKHNDSRKRRSTCRSCEHMKPVPTSYNPIVTILDWFRGGK